MKRRRRGNGGGRGGPWSAPAPTGAGGGLPGPAWALAVLVVVGLLALGLAAGAVYSFRQPAQRSQSIERLRYEHTGAFGYTVQVEPSSLYPEGVVGPVTASQMDVARGSTGSPRAGARTARPEPVEGRAVPQGPPIFTRLARSLDLGFDYALKVGAPVPAPLPPQVSGEYSAAMRIKAGEQGWSKTIDLLPPTPFQGSQVSLRMPIDFGRVWGIIDPIEKETDFKPGSYDLVVTPTVRVRGSVGPETVDEVYAPPFALKLTRTQITPDGQLAHSQPRSVTDTATEEGRVSLGGLTLPVTTARRAGAGGAAAALALAGLLAAVVFLGLGQDEAAKVRARYGSMLISVAGADLKSEGQRIQVGSMQDLVRLAQRDGRVIFHQELEPGSHRYFIPDGAVTYEYAVAGPPEPAEPRPEPAEGPAGEA